MSTNAVESWLPPTVLLPACGCLLPGGWKAAGEDAHTVAGRCADRGGDRAGKFASKQHSRTPAEEAFKEGFSPTDSPRRRNAECLGWNL